MIRNQLSPNSFRKFPVWKWNDAQEELEPITNWQPLPKYEPTLFLKADFVAVDGTVLEGYLIGLESYYAFGLFVEGTEHVINLNLPDMIETSLQAIRQQLAKEEFMLFPVEYRTELAFEGQPPLKGTLHR